MNTNSIVEEIERTRPVDVAAIERELAELWKAAAKSGEGDSEAVTRVCLLNLLFYTSDERRTDTLSDIIGHVMERVPCRAMVLVGDNDTPVSKTDAWISSHCHLSGNRQQVCCEEIRVTASGNALDNLSRTVAPLLVPDLPVFVWWQETASLDTKLFKGFLDIANRVIVDSGSLTHRNRDFLNQEKMIFDARNAAAFSDLNWTRLAVWRDLIAGFFDAPDMVQYLSGLNRVTLRFAYNGETTGVPLRAMLLVGWLADRLSWKLKDVQELTPNHLEFRFRTPGSRLMLEIQPHENTGFPPEVLTEVVLEAGDRAKFALFRREPKDREDCFETSVEVTDGAAYKRVVSTPRPQDADLLTRELEIFGRDAQYEKAVRLTMEYLAELEADRF